ncbi:hypothetical protein M422DRAFT_246481 [Sphaerobolus stellatus SS14]|nr:hypothetical protein M422DRAFT_246481 [Sphaerobolus stellatus SS14]
MPRQSRSRPAPVSAPRTQTRSATTATAPPAYAPPAPTPHPTATATQSSGGSGIMAQMAATAGSVAAGSVIGHGVSSLLFGGSSSTPAEQAPAAAAQPTQQAPASACEVQAKDFARCVESVSDVQGCNWYLEQLKACQAAARPY